MCPLWPAHIIIMYIAVFGSLWLASFGFVGVAAQALSAGDVTFEPASVKQLLIGSSQEIKMRFNKTILTDADSSLGLPVVEFQYYVDDDTIASVFPTSVPVGNESALYGDQVVFNVTGNFLGYTKVCAKSVDSNNNSNAIDCINVSVIRESRAIDKAFTGSVAALVSIIYINMGAALDTRTLKETIKRPYGPVIGFCSQFLIMPLLSYGIAKLLIPIAALQLGLFITGCSPGGGASNIWTLTLGGNLDLSITMTTISTFSAFAMMPLWILTLGSTIFSEANLTVPYSKIATFAIALVIPLAIGILIQYKLPKIAKGLVKILKPFAFFLIVFIVIFAVYTNLYLFQLFTWRILLAGMLLPWLGYLMGGGVAWLLNQDWRDVVAIGVETGVQNTGLAIFALRFSLEQPEADLTTALPVAVAIMTPVIPTLLILFQKLKGKQCHIGVDETKQKDPLFVQTDDSSSPTGLLNNSNNIVTVK